MSTPQVNKILSVVMPCYNELGTVLTCIEAVLQSDYVSELIIVDDGSTDGTRELLAGVSDLCSLL